MWKYSQKTGSLTNGAKTFTGYSGFGDGKNDPDKQNMADVGPIPCGKYTIGTPSDTQSHGPYVMKLIPDASNKMFGRDGFLIHGDAIGAPGTASHGCIIMSHDTRVAVWTSGDHVLTVIRE